ARPPRGRHRTPAGRARAADGGRRAQPREPPPDARGAVPAPLRDRGGMSALAGTGELTKLTLRRDRVPLPIWIVLLTALVASTGSSYASLYGTPASRRSVVAS